MNHPLDAIIQLKKERDEALALIGVLRRVLDELADLVDDIAVDVREPDLPDIFATQPARLILALIPPDALEELEERVRREERERCCETMCGYCLEHAQGLTVSAAYQDERGNWMHDTTLSIGTIETSHCYAADIREAADE